MQQQLIAGDTLKFDTSVPDYPASDGWTLTYRLIPRVSGTARSFNASADGEDYQVEVSAATTADWTAGEYSWVAYVSKAGERYTVDRGTITILANLAASSGYDERTAARKILDGLLALHETYGAGQGLVSEYSIAGRTMRFRDIADLTAQLRFWKAEVAREERANRVAAGLDSGVTLRARF